MRISLRKLLTVHLSAAAAVIIYLLLPIKCPIRYFLHFDCPTCGMTRAMTALLRGDISSYMSFNPMALPFLLILLFALHKSLIPINNRIKNAIIISGTVCVVIVYIFRVFL